MPHQPPQPRRQPKQGRSRLLVNAIIQACQQILEKEGVEQLSTQRIADVAGVTIGSLYQYFPNKEAIIANLFQEKIIAEASQISQEATTKVLAAVNISLHKTIRELIKTKAELHLHFFELHGEFYRQYHDAIDFHAEVNNCVTEVYQQPSWQEWLPKLLKKYEAEIKTDNLERAAFFISTTIEGLLNAAIEESPDWLSDEDYLLNIEHMTMAYLTSESQDK